MRLLQFLIPEFRVSEWSASFITTRASITGDYWYRQGAIALFPREIQTSAIAQSESVGPDRYIDLFPEQD